MAFLSARWMEGGLLDRTVLESQVPVPLSLRPADSLLLSSGTNIYTIENNHIPSITYVDLKVSKTFGKDNKLEVFGNINNLLDRAPLATPTTIGRAGTGGGINTSLYDVYGRRYTVGVNYVF